MHPSAFGYVRIPASASEQNLRKALADYAERAGYTLAEVFTEHEELGSSAFAALMDALKRSKTPIVIVPSIFHFAHLPGLGSALKNLIERDTCARVVLIHDADCA